MKNAESPFLHNFLAMLNARRVRYAVMRNCEGLPDSLGGSDLDLLVNSRSEAEKVEKIADAAALRQGGRKTCRYESGALVLCYLGKGDAGWWGCHIDVFIGLTYKGRPFADAMGLLDRRVLERDAFYRLAAETDVISFVKEILHNGKTRKDYYPRACQIYADNHAVVDRLFAGLYRQDGLLALERSLSGHDDVQRLLVLSRELRRSLRTNGAFPNICRRFWRVFRRPGYTVAFLGTDGSGKSTLIESIKVPLESMLHGKTYYEHLRPNLLPSLAQLAGKSKTEGPITNPHGGRQADWLTSLLRFSYYYIDYTVGFWLKIFPLLVRRPSLVFFDRYYYEYMIDERRCAVRLLPGFARFFSWFIPKPDLILCLGGDPEKIYARKPETSLEEVERQVRDLRTFCDGNKRAVWIDTTTSVEKSREAALTAIMERMSAR